MRYHGTYIIGNLFVQVEKYQDKFKKKIQIKQTIENNYVC